MNGMNKKLTFSNTRNKMRYEFIPNNPGKILFLHLENFSSTQYLQYYDKSIFLMAINLDTVSVYFHEFSSNFSQST